MTDSNKLTQKTVGKVVFDIDGTLITYSMKPNWDIIDLLRMFHKLKYQIFVHSGGGCDYAKQITEKLGLEELVSGYPRKGDSTIEYDIAVDDDLGEQNWTHDKTNEFIRARAYIIVPNAMAKKGLGHALGIINRTEVDE